MATSARIQWPSPRDFVSAYAQNLMAADSLRRLGGVSYPLRRVANMSSAAGEDVGRRVDGSAPSSGPGLVGFEPAAARVVSVDESVDAVAAVRVLVLSGPVDQGPV